MMRRKRGRFWCLGITTVLVGGLALGDGPHSPLLVQQALREAQACLQRGEPGTAVRVLERQLAHINGDAAYLDLLAQAYDQHLAELHRLGRLDLIPIYLDRLAILNPARAEALRREWQLTGPDKPPLRVVARGRLEDEPPRGEPQPPQDWLSLADTAFLQSQYAQARQYYWRACESQQPLSLLQQQRWAYASWWEIYQLLQSPQSLPCDWTGVFLEARAALARHPDWPFAQDLFREVERRQATQPVSVRHLAQAHNGWYVSESPHFRIYHHHASLAEQVLRLAEHVYAANAWFWFGELTPAPWESPAEIYLYPNSETFSRATGISPSVPGFSTLVYDNTDARRIISRRMDLRSDVPDLLTRLVPHEVTHLSLAGRFGPRPLPRWADEGLAILAEPEEARQHYRQKVQAAAQQGRLLPLEKLLTGEDCSAASDLHIFYGQSLILVEWLLGQGGKCNFVHFIAEAQRQGWEPALRRCYRVQSLQDLASIFQQPAQAASVKPAALPLTLPNNFAARPHLADSSWNH